MAEDNADYQAAIAEDHERKKASYHIILAAMMWRAAARASISARDTYSEERVRIVRYEDIIDGPAETIRPIANWLGITYHNDLLKIPLHNSSASRFNESAGLSQVPNQRWSEVLSEPEIATIQQVAGKSMVNIGYVRKTVSTGSLAILKNYATLPTAVVRAAIANQSRHSSLSTYVWRRLLAALK